MKRRIYQAASTMVALALAGCASGPPADIAAAAPPSIETPPPGSVPPRTLEAFRDGAPCHDRETGVQAAVVDSHLHFRPFGGPALPFGEVTGYLESAGVLFANMYGIGQMLPVDSSCVYYLDCLGKPVEPTLKNDFVNAMNYVTEGPHKVRLTLSMTFPNLAQPESVMAGMALLDREFPGLFRWMGEVNLVKQALFGNGHMAVPLETIAKWAPFMAVLRERGIPLAIHSDLGSDAEPMRYLPWIEEVLRLYPDNKIVWMHLGLSRELAVIDADAHIGALESLFGRYPNLMADISWRVIDDNLFSDPDIRARYVPFLNLWSERILPGTDFVASANKNFDVYARELRITGRILGHLDDEAYRDIALGGNYFRLLELDYRAPEICRPAA